MTNFSVHRRILCRSVVSLSVVLGKKYTAVYGIYASTQMFLVRLLCFRGDPTVENTSSFWNSWLVLHRAGECSSWTIFQKDTNLLFFFFKLVVVSETPCFHFQGSRLWSFLEKAKLFTNVPQCDLLTFLFIYYTLFGCIFVMITIYHIKDQEWMCVLVCVRE